VPSQKFDDLEPTLEDLAARTAHRGDVIVAKLDIRANDVPGIGINCLLYPKGGGEVHACYYHVFNSWAWGMLSKVTNLKFGVTSVKFSWYIVVCRVPI